MFGIPINDWAWIFAAAGGVASIWAFQSWRRQKAGKPKHIVALLALAGVCYALGFIILTGFDVWSWSLTAILIWFVILLTLAGSLYFDVIKSVNFSGDGGGSGGGHDGHHTLTPILAGLLSLGVILTIGHGAISALTHGANTVQTGPTVASIVHHHGHHGKK